MARARSCAKSRRRPSTYNHSPAAHRLLLQAEHRGYTEFLILVKGQKTDPSDEGNGESNSKEESIIIKVSACVDLVYSDNNIISIQNKEHDRVPLEGQGLITVIAKITLIDTMQRSEPSVAFFFEHCNTFNSGYAPAPP